MIKIRSIFEEGDTEYHQMDVYISYREAYLGFGAYIMKKYHVPLEDAQRCTDVLAAWE